MYEFPYSIFAKQLQRGSSLDKRILQESSSHLENFYLCTCSLSFVRNEGEIHKRVGIMLPAPFLLTLIVMCTGNY